MRLNGRFGPYGGAYVPEILMPALEQLEAAFLDAQADPAFEAELGALLSGYAGRPTPLTLCQNLGSGKARIYLKREDLLHGGAHKTNQVLGQALLARRMGKTRLIAETGAGQHGVATALAGALFGLETRIYMGAHDVERQQLNVFRMKLMGAEVVPVESGQRGLKDAINEALRDWTASFGETHYLLGTAAGPHPFPTMVREFQRVVGREARAQLLEAEGRLPDAIVAAVGGGSNAIGAFADFIADDGVRLVGVEAAGKGLDGSEHGATLLRGRRGILHGAETFVLQDEHGQISESWSVSAGLDYPGVGPEHAHLKETGRAEYVGATDREALDAFALLARSEGIIPAFESAHALAHALKIVEEATEGTVILVNLSGRGDKDMEQAQKLLQSGSRREEKPSPLVGEGWVEAKTMSTAPAAVPSLSAADAARAPPQPLPTRGRGHRGANPDRYTAMFARLRGREEGAFGAFVMLGDSDLATSARILDVLVEGGADMLEVGIPFSDPVADGPTIQAAATRALAAGIAPPDCLRLLADFRARHPHVPVGVLTYANLVMSYGHHSYPAKAREELPFTPFYRACAEAGVDSVLVADVPTLEGDPFAAAARAHGIAPVLIAAPNTPEPTLARIAALGEGYTYCVARTGVTGAERAMELAHEELFAALDRHLAPPPVLGFGISTPDQVRTALAAGAAGVISGSAIVKLVGTGDLEAVSSFVRRMKAAAATAPQPEGGA